MLRRLSKVPEIEAGPPLGADISGAVGRTDGNASSSNGGGFATGAAGAAGGGFAGVGAGDVAAVAGLVGGPIEIAGIAGRDRGPVAPMSMGLVMTTAGDAAAGAAATGFAAGDLGVDASAGRAGGCGAAAGDRWAGARCCDADGPNTFCFCDSGCAEAAG
jgi:hypothetical protein